MLPFGKFTTELLGRIDGGVDFTAEVPLGLGDRCNYIVKEDVIANDEEIEVARRSFLSGRNRAKNEGDTHAVCDGHQSVFEHLSDSEGLPNQGAKLLKNRASAVCLKVNLATFDGPGQDAGPCQSCQIPLDRAGAQTDRLNDAPLVETLIGMAKEERQARAAASRREALRPGPEGGLALRGIGRILTESRHRNLRYHGENHHDS